MVDHRAPPRYRSYLLRFWQERRGSGDGAAVWRFSLEDPHTRVRHGFATLAQLIAAVTRQMDDALNTQADKESTMRQQDHVEDEAAIRAAIKQVETGWNAGDGDAFAAPFAEDADYVVVDGRYARGRAVIAAGHQHIFDTFYRSSRNSATIRSIRWLRDDVAVAHVEWRLRLQQDGAQREARAVNTMVLTRDDGIWQIAAFQNTPLQGERYAAPEPEHRNGESVLTAQNQ